MIENPDAPTLEAVRLGQLRKEVEEIYRNVERADFAVRRAAAVFFLNTHSPSLLTGGAVQEAQYSLEAAIKHLAEAQTDRMQF
ncbi:hypothetical protein NKJ09_22900 [Mesorhizobium sp. M0189]|uniref:hypothetical protein n=1 Tax=Mesorhizobium sp. M0189 TaxID=2956909 RepID=UPI003335F175